MRHPQNKQKINREDKWRLQFGLSKTRGYSKETSEEEMTQPLPAPGRMKAQVAGLPWTLQNKCINFQDLGQPWVTNLGIMVDRSWTTSPTWGSTWDTVCGSRLWTHSKAQCSACVVDDAHSCYYNLIDIANNGQNIDDKKHVFSSSTVPFPPGQCPHSPLWIFGLSCIWQYIPSLAPEFCWKHESPIRRFGASSSSVFFIGCRRTYTHTQ